MKKITDNLQLRSRTKCTIREHWFYLRMVSSFENIIITYEQTTISFRVANYKNDNQSENQK